MERDEHWGSGRIAELVGQSKVIKHYQSTKVKLLKGFVK